MGASHYSDPKYACCAGGLCKGEGCGRAICSRSALLLPLRQEMELPRNQLSCVATRGVPGPRALGDVSGERPGECGSLWWSNTSCKECAIQLLSNIAMRRPAGMRCCGAVAEEAARTGLTPRAGSRPTLLQLHTNAWHC